jgi:PAT family beta-lactamase induction signal transducer AmpG
VNLDQVERAPSLARAFLSRRSLVMAALGFASGLPYAIANETSGVLLAELKIDRETIGLFGGIGVIYAAKFLWSPLVDARAVPGLARLGRRRSWLVATQAPLIALIAAIAVLAPTSASSPLLPLAVLLAAIAIVSATQDIVVNAWTVDAFPRRELGIGSAMSVGGYRIALLAGGAAAPLLATSAGWPTAFLVLAATMGVGLTASLAASEPAGSAADDTGFWVALVAPIKDLVLRIGPWLVLVAAMVLLFRLPDQLGNTMQKSLLLDTLGFAKQQYGVARNGVGLAATMVGSLIGAALVAKAGLGWALAIGATLQAASNLGFAWIAGAVDPMGGVVQPWTSGPMLSLLAVGSFENLCGGIVATVFVAWLMSLCERRFAATQYAALSGLMALAGGFATAASGFLATRMGWAGFFAWSAAAGLPGLLLAPLAARAVRRVSLGQTE